MKDGGMPHILEEKKKTKTKTANPLPFVLPKWVDQLKDLPERRAQYIPDPTILFGN